MDSGNNILGNNFIFLYPSRKKNKQEKTLETLNCSYTSLVFLKEVKRCASAK